MLTGEPVRERADAARNREKVLAAAARLFAEKGVEAVSMDAVAAEAGVGKGTLFRRFGDKSGLAVALLDARERDLQRRVLSGPPPLGPGAPAPDRLTAFVTAYLDYLYAHLDLVRMSETASPGARYRIGAYRFWHRHLAILLGEARPDGDADVLAHTLLAAMGAEAAGVLRDEYGRDRAVAGVTALAAALANPR
ncbi:MAG: TetR/AcrR family transcriptional regulator [Nonomuraea sp.]|nr:TetR/AcrR family transcriptional regulator [Nonomuraea sp.]NUP77808.1 TetR/AcrR family transcriptional regulator [Nonomuraea sp.]